MHASMWPNQALFGNFALGAHKSGGELATLRKPIAARNSSLNTRGSREVPARTRKRGHRWRNGD